MKTKPIVGIIMGSQNDMRVMAAACEALKKWRVPFETAVVSAHRTPDWMYNYAKTAQKRGLKILIAGAGGAAHLPGMVASLTTLPVIGVPIKVGSLQGLDALLSVAQMPKGVPVATVAVDNSYNAALLAVRILGAFTKDTSDAPNPHKITQKKLMAYQKKMKNKILSARSSV